MKRRKFLEKSLAGLSILPFFSSNALGFSSPITDKNSPKISLAQWSLHRQFFNGHLDPLNFASIASNSYGIKALEYVNQFYKDHSKNGPFWQDMKRRADDQGVSSLLIMVDDEGDLGISNAMERNKAVENHFKWVDAAKILGCHSIRVNAFGESDEAAYRSALIDGMGSLADYAAKENINVIIENHGLFSSDAKLIAGIVKEVNKNNFGTFPDFGNWCLSAKWGSTQIPCKKMYDRYQGVAEFLPYAKAVSAKSYDFNEAGEDSRIDYQKMLKIVKDAGYEGYIGIEYEGSILSEEEGIKATKALIERTWANLD